MGMPKIGAVIALDGEREYKSTIASINSEQRTLRSEMNLTTEKFYDQQNSIEALTEKNRLLKEQHELQTRKVEECRKAVEDFTAAQTEASSRVEEAQKNYEEAKKRLEELKNTSGVTREEIAKQEVAVQKASEEVDKSKKTLEQVTKKENEWKKSLYDSEIQLSKTDRALKENEGYMKETKESVDACATSIDRYGKKTKEAGEEAEDFRKKTSEAFTALSAVLASSKILEGVEDIQEALKECTAEAAGFETAMAKVGTIADTNAVPLKKMSSDVLEVSSRLGVAATEISDAAYNAISAGRSTQEAIGFAEQATKLSIGGFTDATTAVDILTTALNAYGLEGEKTAEISDMLVTTQNLGKTTVAELASSMGKVIPIAAAYNVEMDNLSSAYAIMTANGIATAESTTYLKSMMNELGDTGSDVGKILSEKTGKTFAELSKEGMSLGDVIDILGDSVDGDTTRFNMLWSSAEAGVGALSVLNSGSEKYNKTLRAMQGSTGATEKAFGKMADTAEMSKNRMETSMNNLKIAVGESLNPAMEELYATGADLAAWAEDFVNQNPEVVQAVAALTIGVTAFAGSLTMATAAMKTFELAKALVNPASLLTTAIIGATAALTSFAVMMASSAKSSNEWKNDVDKLTESNKNFNKTMEDSIQGFKANRDSMNTSAGAAQKLGKELQELNGKEKLSSDEKVRMKSIVDQLNQAFPEMNLSISEQTGYVEQNNAEIQRMIDSYTELAKAEAAQEDLKEIARQQYEAEKEMVELTAKREEAQLKFNEAQEEASRIQKEYAADTEKASSASYEYQAQAFDCSAAMKELDERIAETNGTLNELGDEYNRTADYIRDHSAMDETGAAVSDMGERTDGAAAMIAERAEVITQSFSEMGSTIKDVVSEQMDVFAEYEEKTKISKEQLLKNMEDQVGAVQSWGDNLSELAGRADENGQLINEGLLSHLVELGPEGAGYVQAFVQMTDDQLKEANELWAESVSLPDTIAEKFVETGANIVAGLKQGLEENTSTVEESMSDIADKGLSAVNKGFGVNSPSKETRKTGKELIAGLTLGVKENTPIANMSMTTLATEVLTTTRKELAVEKFAAIGKQIDDGLAKGIRDGKSSVINAAAEVARAAVTAAKTELGIASPSKVTAEMGGYYMDGWVLGIRRKTGELKDAVRGALDTALVQEPMSTDGKMNATKNVGDIQAMEAEGLRPNIQVFLQPQQLTKDDLDMAFDYVNERFGYAL